MFERPINYGSFSPAGRLSPCFVFFLYCASACGAESRLVEVGPLPPTHEYLIQAVQFLNPSDGWAYTAEGLWQTRDGGTTWAAVPLPGANARLSVPPQVVGMHFDSTTTGFVRVVRSQVERTIGGYVEVRYETRDEGKTWLQQPPLPDGRMRIFSQYFLSGGIVGWVGGARVSPMRPQISIDPGCISPPDKSGLEPAIFRTIDGGHHWLEQSLSLPSGCPISKLFFRNERNGLAASGHHLYYTVDGGITWLASGSAKNCSAEAWQDSADWNEQVHFFSTTVTWAGSARSKAPF